jgi:hypothetical protein
VVTPRPDRQTILVVALLSLFACRLAFLAIYVPPWQHPDEPQHVEYIVTLVRHHSFAQPREIDPLVSAEVVHSMARYHWWEYSGLPVPAVLPRSVLDLTQSSALQHPRLYHVFSAALLRGLGIDDLMAQYRALRLVSVLLALCGAAAVWAGTRRAFGGAVAAGALALLVLHPQFAVVSTAVNPEALVNLAGAVVWWQGARAVRGPRRAMALVAVVSAAVIGALSKRAGFPLLAVATAVAAVSLAAAWRASRWNPVRPLLLALLIAGLGAVVAFVLLPDWSRAVRYGVEILELQPLASVEDPHFLRDFSRNFFQSAWLNAGWLTLPAPPDWYVVAAAVTGLAPLGALCGLSRRLGAGERTMVAVAAVFVAVQLAAIYGTYFRAGYPAQGRYLFPAIGPLLVLIWLGAVHWPKGRVRRAAAVVLLTTAVWLDARAWTEVIVPGFSR